MISLRELIQFSICFRRGLSLLFALLVEKSFRRLLKPSINFLNFDHISKCNLLVQGSVPKPLSPSNTHNEIYLQYSSKSFVMVALACSIDAFWLISALDTSSALKFKNLLATLITEFISEFVTWIGFEFVNNCKLYFKSSMISV